MNKMRRVIQVLAVLVLLAGAAVFLYPRATRLLYNREMTAMAATFEEDVAGERDPKLEELYQRLLKENERLYREGQKDLKDPFSYQQPSIDLEEYGIRDNIIGYLVIPQMEVTLPLYLGANEENMQHGAAHLTETSYPVGGVHTNAVIAAHRGYFKADMFRNIQKLQLGDEITLRNFREVLRYRVSEIQIIEPDESDKILIQPDRDMLTLLSCHPYGNNTHRYVVYFDRVE